MSKLFTPFTLRNVTMKNRIVMSPMCMYSSDNQDGIVTNWHKVHYTSRAVGQVGTIILEATAVSPEGRITDQDLGIWADEQVSGLKELVQMCKDHGSVMGIQLAHAGRKSMAVDPCIAPSSIPFNDQMRTPLEMSLEQIKEKVAAFKQAAIRARDAGFDVIEIHAAHGYLINEFLSPLTNHRQDAYGGDRNRRYQFLKEILDEVRPLWQGPLFVRISANDYHPDGLHIDDYLYYTKKMMEQGVDLIDCSSGAVVPAHIHTFPGYQVPYSERIRNEVGIATGTVGLISSPVHAEEILQNERADLILLARELLRDPYWPRKAALELGYTLPKIKQYERGW